MALRFRRSIKLAPGIRMNLSKSGMSWTLGPRGAFAALPCVQRVTFSGFSQRIDPATGQPRDDYLYSVSVERMNWERIHFGLPEMVDVVESLAQFDIRRQMTKTGIFKPIEPF